MELNLSNDAKESVEVGDVITTNRGYNYILVKVGNDSFPYAFINLETFEERNAFVSLSFINKNRYVSGGEIIKKVIKSKDLVLSVKGYDGNE